MGIDEVEWGNLPIRPFETIAPKGTEMQTLLRQGPAWAFLAIGILFSSGCSSSLGQSFGLSAPQHKLIPDAKDFRNAAAPPAGAPRELAKTLHPNFVVEPGDILLVQPVELDAAIRLPADQTVLPDGTIDLSPYGRPIVAGKTVAVIESEVQQLIRKQVKDPITITVRLIGRNSKVYYVLGEVNAPGVFPITGRETVLDGLIAAGGLTRKASEKSILVSRPTLPEGCRIVLPVCYPQIVQLGDTTTNYQLMPGDRIFVPSQTLLEGLFPKKVTPPCCGPQTPCLTGGCATGGCGAGGGEGIVSPISTEPGTAPATTPASKPMPSTPAPSVTLKSPASPAVTRFPTSTSTTPAPLGIPLAPEVTDLPKIRAE